MGRGFVRRAHVSTLALCATLSSCGGEKPASVQPTVAEGRYVLADVGGRAMPVKALNLPGRRYYIWYDTLVVQAGQFTQIYMYRDSLSDFEVVQNGGTGVASYHTSHDTIFTQTTTRVDTAFVTAAGIVAPVKDPTTWFCPTGSCNYFFRRLQ